MKRLVLYSGLPGSGKSSAAEKYVKENGSGKIFTTDDFFMVNGEYNFQYKFISAAHKYNLGRAALAMFHGEPLVVVPNTNLQDWEVIPYIEVATDAGYEVDIIEPKTKWRNDPEECAKRNTHGVPLATIQGMAAKKQSIKQIKESVESKLNRLNKQVRWVNG